jgi:hypothetical protein
VFVNFRLIVYSSTEHMSKAVEPCNDIVFILALKPSVVLPSCLMAFRTAIPLYLADDACTRVTIPPKAAFDRYVRPVLLRVPAHAHTFL